MTDLREGRIQAFLDEEMDAEARRTFMHEMARDDALAAAVRIQRTRMERVHAALEDSGDRLHAASAEVHDALRTVLQRVPGWEPSRAGEPAEQRSTTGRPATPNTEERGRASRRMGAAGLAKAAGFLLFATGLAAATVPGSPVRAWLGGIGDSPEATIDAPSTTGAAVAPDGPERMGIRLPAGSGPLEVVVAGPLSAPLTVALVDEPALQVLADQGTSFSTSEGRIEIRDARGPVSVYIPREAGDVAVRVAGSLYLRKVGGRVEVLHQGVDTLPSEFVFPPAGQPRE